VGSFEGNGDDRSRGLPNTLAKKRFSSAVLLSWQLYGIHAIAAAAVPSYGWTVRCAMAAAADGFRGATGEVTACSGTEGPGFTSMIMTIAGAAAARTPLLVLASNVQISARIGKHLFRTRISSPPLPG